jgi:putative colanic acid biosysnthesis UDP-glucose lipid carrier transferase
MSDFLLKPQKKWNRVLKVVSKNFDYYNNTEREDDLLQRSYAIRKSRVKKTIDIFISTSVILFIFSWLFPIIGIIIRLTSKGPVLFTQDREGIDKKSFKCFKFRTMTVDSKDVDASGKYLQATNNDFRITKFGRFLRKTSLDEFPQFLNVLKGDMSIVGPRPHPIPLNKESEKLVQGYNLRHLVKPGITGMAQINGLRGETRELYQMQKRVDADIQYIKKWRRRTDLIIIYKTIINVITGDPQAY